MFSHLPQEAGWGRQDGSPPPPRSGSLRASVPATVGLGQIKDKVVYWQKKSACSAENLGSVAWLGRAPGERNGNPLEYGCLESSMDRGAW